MHFGAFTVEFYTISSQLRNSYLNNYDVEGHRELATRITQLEQPWVVTYDHAAVQVGLFPSHRRIIYGLTYSAQNRYKGKEVMFLSNRLKLPVKWRRSSPFPMRHAQSRYPVYGILEGVETPSKKAPITHLE